MGNKFELGLETCLPAATLAKVGGLVALLVLFAGNGVYGQLGQPNNYVVGPQDILANTPFDQEDLTRKYPVDADGTFAFPLVGRVKAGGLTLRELEAEMKRLS